MKATQKTLVTVSLGLALLGLSGLSHADGTSAQRTHARYVAAQDSDDGQSVVAGGLIVPMSMAHPTGVGHNGNGHAHVADCLASNNRTTKAD